MRRHDEPRGFDRGKLIPDQTHSVGDEILGVVESMTNTIQGLITSVKCMQKELKKIQNGEVIDSEEEEEEEFDPRKHLPRLPETTVDSNGFRKWVDKVESAFLKWKISRFEQVKVVASTLPSQMVGKNGKVRLESR